MQISKIKSMLALLTGGVAGILKYFLKEFNTQILGSIKDKTTGLKYLRDAQAVYDLTTALLQNHETDLTQEQVKRGRAIVAALEELTKALEDFHVEETELDNIIEKVNAAIDAFKKAK